MANKLQFWSERRKSESKVIGWEICNFSLPYLQCVSHNALQWKIHISLIALHQLDSVETSPTPCDFLSRSTVSCAQFHRLHCLVQSELSLDVLVALGVANYLITANTSLMTCGQLLDNNKHITDDQDINWSPVCNSWSASDVLFAWKNRGEPWTLIGTSKGITGCSLLFWCHELSVLQQNLAFFGFCFPLHQRTPCAQWTDTITLRFLLEHE